MLIGILETGLVAEPLVAKHGTYPQMFEKLFAGEGFTFQTFTVMDGVFPENINACDAWLITGSPFGAYEDHAFIPVLEKFIQDSYADNVPLVGVCFGHQIMAQALGGTVEKFDGGWGVGHIEYAMGEDQKSILAMHQDQVVKKPSDATVIASNDFCQNAGLAYKGSAISFQPHPEFSPDYMRDLIEYRAGSVIPLEQAIAAKAGIGEENDAGEIAQQLIRFFKNAAASKVQAAE